MKEEFDWQTAGRVGPTFSHGASCALGNSRARHSAARSHKVKMAALLLG